MSMVDEVLILITIFILLFVILYFIYNKVPQPYYQPVPEPYCMHSRFGCCPLSPTLREDAVGSNC